MSKSLKWTLGKGIYFKIPPASEDAMCYRDGKLLFWINYNDLEDLYFTLQDGDGHTFEGPDYEVTLSQTELEHLYFMLNDTLTA